MGAVDLPIGSIGMYNNTPTIPGMVLLDGSAISRTTYADLYAEQGDTYGAGDGSTTFNTPDARGRVLVGAGGNYVEAGTGGFEEHTITEAELPAHTHEFSKRLNQIDGSQSRRDVDSQTTFSDTDVTGGDAPHNNVQACVALNFYVKGSNS